MRPIEIWHQTTFRVLLFYINIMEENNVEYYLKNYCELIDSDINELQFSFLNSLCEKAKILLITCNKNFKDNFDYIYYNIDDMKNLTPIEQIFKISFYYYLSIDKRINQFEEIIFKDGGCENNHPSLSLFWDNLLFQQYEIDYNNKKYRADFVIDFSGKCQNGQYWFPKLKNLKYVIELDGFESHSSKKQVNYDYDRENNLKSLGYKVIRFTGSQIYNKPFQTINKLFDIMYNDIRKEIF